MSVRPMRHAANVYERLGCRTIINAAGPSTRVSGGIMAAEVADAMREASQHCVDMAELHARAATVIAEATGAESGLATSGAAAGLLLGTAACLTGLDPAKMNRLPDTSGMKNEVVIVRSQRNFYDHAVRTAGVRLVEVGLPDRFSGAGVRDAEAWEIGAAIGERTAMVFYVAQPNALPPLPAVVATAHKAGVPVLVDAAAQLPPAENLRRFIAEGADLVVFSGGKAIGGPQASGILCGRRDLIAAAALQTLDLDIPYDMWFPPSSFIDKSKLAGLPHHGIGRACKVGKEEIIGLVAALQRFAGMTAEARSRPWFVLCEALIMAAAGLRHAKLDVVVDPKRPGVPAVELRLDGDADITLARLLQKLHDGEPSIRPNLGRLADGALLFSPMCMKPGEPEVIGRELLRHFGRTRGAVPRPHAGRRPR